MSQNYKTFFPSPVHGFLKHLPATFVGLFGDPGERLAAHDRDVPKICDGITIILKFGKKIFFYLL
jgi:hypothetical protein